jgi:hypothetical protein
MVHAPRFTLNNVIAFAADCGARALTTKTTTMKG